MYPKWGPPSSKYTSSSNQNTNGCVASFCGSRHRASFDLQSSRGCCRKHHDVRAALVAFVEKGKPMKRGGWKMIFLFNWVIFLVPAVNFSGFFGLPIRKLLWLLLFVELVVFYGFLGLVNHHFSLPFGHLFLVSKHLLQANLGAARLYIIIHPSHL